ncbi:MAG TPA: PEP-CTERM sorting domain-containing protein [Opitutaceae bacterium]|nr:PEP-CTERM sorting domain-containing protein [Opitutaceae bacterium]
MKSILKKVLTACALFGIAAVSQAQLYIATGSTGVTTWFNFTIDPVLNRVTVDVDNTHAGPGGINGVVTSFGFNLPPTLAGTGSLLSVSGVPSGSWSYFEPYDLNAGGGVFVQDVGSGSGPNPNGGHPPDSVAFGSSATFVFQYADFSVSDLSAFLGTDGMTSRWQAIAPGGGSDEGFGNPGPIGGPDLGAVPEPSTYGLIGAAVLIVGVLGRRASRKSASL